MIFTGIDLVYIPRFYTWIEYTDTELATLFSANEIAEFHTKTKDGKADFLASRFAVKEAVYKALSAVCVHTQTTYTFSLRTIARFIEVKKDERWHAPYLYINTHNFTTATGFVLPEFMSTLSLSHERDYATAHVVLIITTL